MHKMISRRPVFVLLSIVLLLALAACGGKKEAAPASEPPAAEAAAAPVGDAAAGEKVYQSTCVACHGPDAKGIEGLGKSLHPSDSEFISTKTDPELVEYITVGRTPDDPLNTTGVGMPAKGGNPALSEEDMYNVVAFIRGLE